MKRTASHAGSWYSSAPATLSGELNGWLTAARADAASPPVADGARARAIIAPHAGYSYSGPTAAYAYRWIDPTQCDRIFILGPSHHAYLEGCALTRCQRYATPLGDLTVDHAMVEELKATGKFDFMTTAVDEAEHSIEMHLPYIVKAMERRTEPYTIVPILVGNLDNAAEAVYGRLLAPYLADARNFFIVSSDFCHWGARFSYRQIDKAYPTISEGIEALDRRGMREIEALNPAGFAEYLAQTRNTICGRHPIGVLLHAVAHLQAAPSPGRYRLVFTKYAQSSRAQRASDSSVSYASAVLSVS